VRIAWFTPFSPRSAIGHYSEAIVGELRKAHDVVLFVPGDEGVEAPRVTPHPAVTMPDLPTDEIVAALQGFDAVVYNMGNFPRYHLAIYETARRHPGVVVLHDLVMRDFFLAYACTLLARPHLFPALLGYAHGPDAEAHGRDVIAGRVAELEDPRRLTYPLFRPCLRGAVGAVVHSEYARGRVAADTGLPVAKLDFPLFGPARELAHLTHTPRPADGPVRVLTFGVVAPNKLVHATVAAIGRSELLRRRVRFEVIGGGEKAYMAKLADLTARLHLGEVVTLAGWQPDDRLKAALADADVVVNLRNPHTGESSASLLDSLVSGVPTVVWDHGFYAEFPDDVVVKIRSESELGPALERLVGDAELRGRMGRAAREHAVKRFDTAAYCTGLVKFLEEAFFAAPLAGLADRTGDVLAELGCGPDDDLARRISREIAGWAT
jgi:glycosyltransferase involved in cell wall biosynthesis